MAAKGTPDTAKGGGANLDDPAGATQRGEGNVNKGENDAYRALKNADPAKDDAKKRAETAERIQTGGAQKQDEGAAPKSKEAEERNKEPSGGDKPEMTPQVDDQTDDRGKGGSSSGPKQPSSAKQADGGKRGGKVGHLVSDGHRKTLAKRREEKPDLGSTKGPIDDVVRFLGEVGANSVLDYGCGQEGQLVTGMASRSPTFKAREFDPTVEGKDEQPSPADLVVVHDYLPYVEQGKVSATLDHIEELARRGVYIAIPVHQDQKAKELGVEKWAHQMEPWDWLTDFAERWPFYVFRDSGPSDNPDKPRMLVFEGRTSA